MYVLADDGMTPVAVSLDNPADVERLKAMEAGAMRKVANTEFGSFCEVSTVFLSTDHNFRFVGPPVLWETMVFGGPWDEEQWRDTSWCPCGGEAPPCVPEVASHD